MMAANRWAPLLAGLVVGLIAGTYYAWVINPVEYVGTAPGALRQTYKEDYLALIASAYAATGDLARAQARLQLFPDPDPAQTLGALAQQRLATGRSELEARALAELAAQLGGRSAAPAGGTGVAGANPSPTPSPATATRTPSPSPSPLPTRTPSATLGAPFELFAREKVCDPDLAEPLIQVEVFDAAGSAVPGVEVLVLWDAGQDHFFTGLKPELGSGYGDFTMTEGVSYTVRLADSDQLITGLQVEDCADDDGRLYPGSWKLSFEQPPP